MARMDTAKENPDTPMGDKADVAEPDEQGTNAAADTVAKATAWLDDKLVPILGTAPLGPYEPDERDDPNPGPADLLCPVCHHAFSRHETRVDAHTQKTYLICPGLGTALEVEAHEETAPADPGTQNGPVLS
jgi:hypothetical protein